MTTHQDLLDELTPSPHDRELTGVTHPADWVNPTPRDLYDTVVLGGGAAGLVAAGVVGAAGGTVALIESKWLGGDCTVSGCVPSKALLHAANVVNDARMANSAGWIDGPAPSVDGAAVLEMVRQTRARIAHSDGTDRMSGYGVDIFLGYGSFVSPNTIEVGGATLLFRTAIVATGSKPSLPPIPGLAAAVPLTNETVFNLADVPPRLGVVGAGPIGCELGQAFARLGSEVTMFEAADRVLPGQDLKAAAAVADALRRDGVTIHTSADVSEATRSGNTVTIATDERDVEVDEVLVSTGRRPNVDGFGLDVAGVTVDGGRIVIDEQLRTSAGHIFAIGDVALEHTFTHEAAASAQIAAVNSLLPGKMHRSYDSTEVSCIFTDPSVAHFGPARDGLEEHTVDMADIDRAVLSGHDEGWVTLYTRPGKTGLVGATVVGRGAEEILSQVLLAHGNGTSIVELGAIKFPYPSLGMGFQHIAANRMEKALDGRGGRFLARFLALRRRRTLRR